MTRHLNSCPVVLEAIRAVETITEWSEGGEVLKKRFLGPLLQFCPPSGSGLGVEIRRAMVAVDWAFRVFLPMLIRSDPYSGKVAHAEWLESLEVIDTFPDAARAQARAVQISKEYGWQSGEQGFTFLASNAVPAVMEGTTNGAALAVFRCGALAYWAAYKSRDSEKVLKLLSDMIDRMVEINNPSARTSKPVMLVV